MTSKKETLKELFKLAEEIADYLIQNTFTKEDLDPLEDLVNELDTALKECHDKLEPLYD